MAMAAAADAWGAAIPHGDQAPGAVRERKARPLALLGGAGLPRGRADCRCARGVGHAAGRRADRRVCHGGSWFWSRRSTSWWW
jgi:hypothetical protein